MNELKKGLRRWLGLIAFAGLTLGIVLYWKDVLGIFSHISAVLRPILLAIVISFFVNLPMRIYERWFMRIFQKLRFRYKETLCRTAGMLLSFLTFIAVVVLAVSLLYPQLRDSITLLIDSFPTYQQNLMDWTQTYLPELELDARLQQEVSKFIAGIPDMISKYAPKLFSFTSSAAAAITDSVIALFLSFYFLISKDKLVRQCKTLLTTYAPRASKKILPVAALVNDKFRKFLGGQLTEAVILGLLCFIGMNILRLPYAPLVSTLIGVTAVIPIIGAFVGVIPSAFIILMDNPLQSLIFIVFIIVLQQVEGNFIYPRVVGDSIGLSGLWVLLAVVLGGGFFGIPGIFIGIPLMSAIYELVRNDIARRRAASAAEKKKEDGISTP